MRNFDQLKKICETTILGTGDSDSHLLSLFSICVSLRAKNILELGVRDGVTTLPLLCAADVFEGKLTSVDIQNTNFVPPKDLARRWNFIKSSSIDFLENLKQDDVFDVVYVDDWHSYEHVKKELEILDSHVSLSSVILLHDLMYGNYEPHYHTDLATKSGQWANGGPYRAVCELSDNFWEFSTIPSCNGLTILRKKHSSRFKFK